MEISYLDLLKYMQKYMEIQYMRRNRIWTIVTSFKVNI